MTITGTKPLHPPALIPAGQRTEGRHKGLQHDGAVRVGNTGQNRAEQTRGQQGEQEGAGWVNPCRVT